MSSITQDIVDETAMEHIKFGFAEFSRLEKMLLFAVITECERCICSEGKDCIVAGKSVACPFVPIREEYQITDVQEWKGMIA
ncbi:MAG: hypothetical protein KKH41_05160 [Candidatus Thermoplasmatota archaeon]|nr:hypothetical protein [Euryarchaeota archaeon]MBU4031842.1 hypothetical protein [Candidatus Thermoplasmatota archaeon]MBU4071254.1 hypothetical protein [Candidatus Thermoplasmatota archaeon]MBU4144827.1 hypothetical protein [Candidatus Thermoplasmatota archaeon]MBU4591956.1 hypothetical protein [Candidatus Thermoplasmatota archaeon]